jgi:hypothetical protein
MLGWYKARNVGHEFRFGFSYDETSNVDRLKRGKREEKDYLVVMAKQAGGDGD